MYTTTTVFPTATRLLDDAARRRARRRPGAARRRRRPRGRAGATVSGAARGLRRAASRPRRPAEGGTARQERATHCVPVCAREGQGAVKCREIADWILSRSELRFDGCPQSEPPVCCSSRTSARSARPSPRRCARPGYHVEGRETGDGFATTVEAFRPDLVILDVMLPRRDGFELARELHGKSDVPFLFLTARDDARSRIAGFELGADDYVVKPFLTEELLARVRALLRRIGTRPLERRRGRRPDHRRGRLRGAPRREARRADRDGVPPARLPRAQPRRPSSRGSRS